MRPRCVSLFMGRVLLTQKETCLIGHSEEGPPVPIQEYVILKLVLLHINVHLFLNPITIPKEKPGHRWLRKHRLHRIHCCNSEYLGGIQCF